MNDRERAHALLDEFSNAEIEEIARLLRVRREDAEPEMAELPPAWRHLPSGEPAPNWVAAVNEARRAIFNAQSSHHHVQKGARGEGTRLVRRLRARAQDRQRLL